MQTNFSGVLNSGGGTNLVGCTINTNNVDIGSSSESIIQHYATCSIFFGELKADYSMTSPEGERDRDAKDAL